ncbi:beta-mannosidase [Lentzea xinjiangensis]|uniref:beta-mannosidase n=1 Tax=Lentzea xinjiangensis TaxID=402600 RepID=A0A1H9LUK1_9PSEU|nr:glycoside hydrolase family 2 protein [Lentzea xinjiangensis]SER14939.1 beta-mannosidase [Lentzea xinjiangensis]
MIRQYLHDGWQLTATTAEVPDNVRGRTVPATVPGSTHLDLLASGLITDPFLDQAEAELTWMHRADWRYDTSFLAAAVAPGERVDLVFDGLDTVAAVELNGHLAGRTANMHRGYRFDVRRFLVDGANELAVSFSSALTHAEETQAALGRRAHVNAHPFNMIRKMACSFGWDWGPDLQTAGIWRPVRLERWHTARLARVRPVVTVAGDGSGQVQLHVDLEWADRPEEVTLLITVGGCLRTVAVPAGQESVIARVEVPGVALWWPAGYGDQPLYDLDVVLHGATELDRVTRRIGFRTVTVDTTPDETGTPFTVVVNDKPLFVKGANWIPDDHFLTRITRDRLARRVDQAVAAHVNLLRVWGGGIYESDDFYDVCDERGVLVWQDFPLACAAYPEEEPLRGELEAEARENVVRLMSHASLALWNGGNENLWGFADWGWPDQLGGRTWGLGYYDELLPAVVAELDPTRFYCPGSPYSPVDGVHPNDENHGTRHEWRVWNEVGYRHYRDHVPRFCAEFGFQGPPTWATLTRWIHDRPLTPYSPSFRAHQKAEDGGGKLDRGLAAHLPVPRDFPGWHWATQLNQARAVTFGVEHFRSWWPRTAGAVVWQLNDCWPVTSWAAIDGEDRLKPLWYGLRHAFAPRLLTFQPRGDRLVLIAVNDHDEPWDAHLTLDRQTFRGVTLHLTRLRRTVAPRSALVLDLDEDLLEPVHEDAEVVVATTAEARAILPFREDPGLSYDPHPLTARAEAVHGGYEVEVRAESFARDVAVLADRVAPDAVVDDMLVPMLAGEVRVFHIRTDAVVDPAAFTDPLVLRCANDLHADDAGGPGADGFRTGSSGADGCNCRVNGLDAADPGSGDSRADNGPGANGPRANDADADDPGANDPDTDGAEAVGPGANGLGTDDSHADNAPHANNSGADGLHGHNLRANGPDTNASGTGDPRADDPGADHPSANHSEATDATHPRDAPRAVPGAG